MFGRAFGNRRGMLAAAAGIFVYTILVGADPAVVRAAVMGGLSLLALRLGRRTHGLASLGAAGMIMTAASPATLFDVGFQLSFAATLGMILYAQPLQESFESWLTARWTVAPTRASALAGPIGEYFLFTLAAQVTTLPLTAYYFHRLSVVSVLANPAILPAQPAVMVLAGVATLVGSIWLAAGRILALIAWPFAAYTIRVVTWFAALPMANLSLGWINPLWVAGFYGLLFGLTSAQHLPSLPKPRWPSIPLMVGLAALAIGVFVTWDNVGRRPDGRLHLSILDTTGGQAALLRTPSGQAILIDGGRSPIALQNQLGRRLPAFHRTLDWLILASSQEQDLLGLTDLTDRFAVRGVLANDSAGEGAATALIRTLYEDGTPIVPLQSGAALDLGSGARLSIVSADGGDAAISITIDRASVVMVSGSQVDGLSHLLERKPGHASVVVLGQAGEVTPETAQWLAGLAPSLVVVSSDSADQTSLPSPALQTVFPAERLLRTDQHGTIEITTDGTHLWAASEREPKALPSP